MPPEEAESRFEEALSVIVRAFTENDPFSASRPLLAVRSDRLSSRRRRSARTPPLWMAASSAESIKGCAHRGGNLLLDSSRRRS